MAMTIPILLSPLAQAIAAWTRTLAPRTLGLRIAALILNLSHRQKPSLARSYIQLFGIFDKFLSWQVSAPRARLVLSERWE